MKTRPLLATLVLILSSTATLGCDLLNRDASAQTAAQSSSDPKIDAACTNLMLVAGESPERCKREMGGFLDQCPAQRDEVLTCMGSAASADAMTACTQPCMMAGADEIAPPVPPELDTPQLDATCRTVGESLGDPSAAGHEACKRGLAREIGRCPHVQDEVLQCYATHAGKNKDASAGCLLRCVEASLQAEAKAKDDEENEGKGKRGRKSKGKGKRGRKGKRNRG